MATRKAAASKSKTKVTVKETARSSEDRATVPPINSENAIALSIRQPYVEQILRGTKRVEYRSRPTKIRGRVLIYAALQPARDITGFAKLKVQPGDLPTGLVVGSVEVTDCTGEPGDYEWHLAKPLRIARPKPPRNRPQPGWFYPFRRDRLP
jgi:hypothetical protein